MHISSKSLSRLFSRVARFNPGVQVVVLAPDTQRERIELLGASWMDLHRYTNHTAPFSVNYRQGSPGSRHYHTFCHVRWLAVAAMLQERPPPEASVVAILDDDVLLFESLNDRLQEAGRFHPTEQTL